MRYIGVGNPQGPHVVLVLEEWVPQSLPFSKKIFFLQKQESNEKVPCTLYWQNKFLKNKETLSGRRPLDRAPQSIEKVIQSLLEAQGQRCWAITCCPSKSSSSLEY